MPQSRFPRPILWTALLPACWIAASLPGLAREAAADATRPAPRLMAERPYRTVPDPPARKPAKAPEKRAAKAPAKSSGKSPVTKPAGRSRAASAGSGWSMTCANFSSAQPNACRVSFGVYLRKTRQLLLGVSVRLVGKKAAPVLVFRAPFGTFLPGGLKYHVDKSATVKVPYQTCNAKGCFATTPVSKRQLAHLRRGSQLFVIIQNLKRQDIKIGLALGGFAPAYRKMTAR